MKLSSIKPIAQVQFGRHRRQQIVDYDNFGSMKIDVLGRQFSGVEPPPLLSPGSDLRQYNYAIHVMCQLMFVYILN